MLDPFLFALWESEAELCSAKLSSALPLRSGPADAENKKDSQQTDARRSMLRVCIKNSRLLHQRAVKR